jgi:hypothetical protein
MGTLITCVLAQAAEPVVSCQTVSWVPLAASASVSPAAGMAK